jgi:hypothetical protein
MPCSHHAGPRALAATRLRRSCIEAMHWHERNAREITVFEPKLMPEPEVE